MLTCQAVPSARPAFLRTTTEVLGTVPTEVNLWDTVRGVAYGDGRGLMAQRAILNGRADQFRDAVRALEAVAYLADELGFAHLAAAILDDAEHMATFPHGAWRMVQHSADSWTITLAAMDIAWRTANAASRNGIHPSYFDFSA